MTITDLAAPYGVLVSQAAPSKSYFYDRLGYLSLSAESGAQFESVIWFANPFPVTGANVASAKLVLKTRPLAADATIRARLADKWTTRFGALTWNNKPTVTSATATLTKIGAQGNNTVWELDVTALMQTVASGGGWYGFVLTTTNTSLVQVQSPNMGANLAPHLVVDWSVAPLAPASLAPSGGRVVSAEKPVLRFDFRDSVGDTSIAAVQVQANATSTFTSPAFDSGTVATSLEQLDLSATAFVAPAAAATTWWRVRVQDGSGLWSPWSAAQSWVYRPVPTVTISAPAAGTVADPTPPIAWSVSGGTQSASRALVSRQTTAGWSVVDDSGWRIGTDTSWTPSKPMGITGLHRVTVSVRDTYDREATPGASIVGQASRDVTFTPGATAGVTGLTASQVAGGLRLSWARSQAPDEWIIYRDGQSVARVSGLSLQTGSTTYAWTDALAPSGSHTWKVFAVVNKVSAPSSSVTANMVRNGVWILDAEDLSQHVVVAGRDYSSAMPEVGTTFEPVGARTAVRVIAAQRGWEGTMTGILDDSGDGSLAVVWRDRMLAWKPQVGKVFWVLAGDSTFRAVLSDIYVAPDDYDPGRSWRTGFSYRQVDDFTFDPLGG